MARLLQGAPEVASAGIGNQQVVQPASAAQLIQGLTNTAAQGVELAANIYGERKGREIAEESMESIDRARAMLELPEGVGLRGDEAAARAGLSADSFHILEQAQANGTISRDKARLIAQAEVRKRIGEQPFAARQIRQSASGVLGFNIESEAAAQFFSSFPQQGAGQGRQSQMDKWRDQAEAFEQVLGIPVESGMQMLARDEYADLQLNLAKTGYEAGALSSRDFMSQSEAADSETALAGILGELQAAAAEGEPVDNAVLAATIKTKKQAYLNELRNSQQIHAGTLAGEDWTRFEATVARRYDGYLDLINTVGIDNLDQIRLDRADRTLRLLGHERAPDMLYLKATYGERIASEYFNLLTNAGDRLPLLLNRNPMLKRIHEEIGEQGVLARLRDSTLGVLRGNGVQSDEDRQLVAAAAGLAFESSPDLANNLIQELAAAGAEYTAMDIVADRSPNVSSVDNVKRMKRMYEQDVPRMASQVGAILSQFEGRTFGGNPLVRWNVDAQGGLWVTDHNGRELHLSRNPELRAAGRQILDLNKKMSVFGNSFRRGWGEELGTNVEDHRLAIESRIRQGISSGVEATFAQDRASMADNIAAGRIDDARATYERLQQQRPDSFTRDFDTYYREYRRRLAQAGR